MKTTNEPQEEGFMKKADLAKRLGLKSRSIDNWMKAGIIPYMKIGKHAVRFYWPEVKKSLLKLHGGTLSIDSQPGQGTTVTTTFPSARTIALDVSEAAG